MPPSNVSLTLVALNSDECIPRPSPVSVIPPFIGTATLHWVTDRPTIWLSSPLSALECEYTSLMSSMYSTSLPRLAAAAKAPAWSDRLYLWRSRRSARAIVRAASEVLNWFWLESVSYVALESPNANPCAEAACSSDPDPSTVPAAADATAVSVKSGCVRWRTIHAAHDASEVTLPPSRLDSYISMSILETNGTAGRAAVSAQAQSDNPCCCDLVALLRVSALKAAADLASSVRLPIRARNDPSGVNSIAYIPEGCTPVLHSITDNTMPCSACTTATHGATPCFAILAARPANRAPGEPGMPLLIPSEDRPDLARATSDSQATASTGILGCIAMQCTEPGSSASVSYLTVPNAHGVARAVPWMSCPAASSIHSACMAGGVTLTRTRPCAITDIPREESVKTTFLPYYDPTALPCTPCLL